VKELLLRAITGSVYVAVALAAAWAGPFTTMLLFLPVCLLTAAEFHDLHWGRGDGGLQRMWTILLCGTMYLTISIGAVVDHMEPGYGAAMGFLLLLVTLAWILIGRTPRPSDQLAGFILAITLVALPFGLLPHFFKPGGRMLIGFLILLWTNDTGAYLVGRTLGRHKLMPHVSPGKTVEGLAGGLLLAMGVGWALADQLGAISSLEWCMAGLVVGITATLGDLLESAMKRARGVKDSGDLLPGHGGFMDRFDGLLLASPAMMLYVHLVS
jgi:phosphatidate cytidylyltransferase